MPIRDRISLWSRRRRCRRLGHDWPPHRLIQNDCAHVQCLRCDAWQTRHASFEWNEIEGHGCPHPGMSGRTHWRSAP